ncbi:MAG: hypothetical protein KAQ67_03845 [Gammaproteobacteria bacterium]|nr:hypothetical protein [Gammaproteobacteria bacterium]
MSWGNQAQAEDKHLSKYAGQEKRLIKSLSADDIKQLENGRGWGLAKAAELNGMPGPSHILQMKDKISLNKSQEKKIQALFNDMKSQAIPLGKKIIQLEKELNDYFANKSITTDLLNKQLDAIAQVHKQLRYVHLVTHLKTPAVLSSEQIENYNRLRGYGSGDPCKSIPEGHDAQMWKKHNGCS